MKTKWNTLKDQIRGLVSNNEEAAATQSPPPRPVILQDEELVKLRLIARKKNIPIHEAVSQAVDHFYQNTDHKKIKISEEKKERNPLLRLEGLATRSFQKISKGGSQYEGDDATIVR